MENQIYSNIRVLELTNEIGMYCGKLLAETGMEVIKIEPLDGDPSRRWPPFVNNIPDKEHSIFWLYHNTGKKSITINLNSEEGRHQFCKLAQESDVILESLPVGQMEEWGFDYTSLVKTNERLIMCSITPFGQTGPYRNWKASSDMLPFALGGNMYEIGIPGMNYAPLNFGRNLCNNAACMYAATAILAALREQKKSGKGCYIDMSVSEAAALWRCEAMANTQRFPSMLDRQKNGSKGPFPPTGLFRCKDGSVYISGMAQWSILVDWCIECGIDVGEFSDSKYRIDKNDNPDITAHENEINSLLAELCSRYTRAEICAEGKARHVPIEPMNTPEDIFNDTQFGEREYFVNVRHEKAGETLYPGAPVKFTKTPLKVDVPAPELGSSNKLLFEWFMCEHDDE